MNKMNISFLILIVEILVWNASALEIVDLTNSDNDLDDNKPAHTNNYDLNDLLSNVILDYSTTRPPKPPADYQYPDMFELPISTNNQKNYDYEFVINHYDHTTRPTPHERKKLIYIPVDYSIEFRNDKFEYSTRKSETTLARLLSSSLNNSTRFNLKNETHSNRSNLTHFNLTHINSTRLQLTTTKNLTLNATNTTNSTSATTTQKKVSFEKTYLKLESSFDEAYDIDSIPRKHGMRHLIEKRIHNHDDKMPDNTIKDTDFDTHDKESYHHHHHYHNYNSGHALENISLMQLIYIMSAFFLLIIFIVVLLVCRKNTASSSSTSSSQNLS